ncbi:hypothetical protein DOTSEDRAFT_72114 [Dothistroma septosporum NZE10]|uniref:Uncharacterized protein n=1 Tax=Dothistroma septosporum (strain NZE10 / CBS 128990) TaxID=675120 RepID=N1PMC3_DOTSN|nr:hypothetical protein DOTSEDRAFT_72114 [Dothistroma septosporum NZE10]
MAALATFRQRLQWTQGWLGDFARTQDEAPDDFQVVDDEDNSPSNRGVGFLSDHDAAFSWTEVDGQDSCVCLPTAALLETGSNDDDFNSRCTWDKRYSVWDWSPDCQSRAWPHCGCCSFPWPGCRICLTLRPTWTPHDAFYYIDDSDVEHTPRSALIAYELAGREVENTFRDLRSASKARKRQRTASHKYYGWRFIKPGQLNKPHYDTRLGEMDDLWPKSRFLSELKVVTMDKNTMYRQALLWPRPPTYHRRSREKDQSPWRVCIDRRKAQRKHPQHDFSGSCTHYYDLYFAETEYCDYNDDLAETWHDGRVHDYCYPCGYVHWSRCCIYNLVEVDQIDEIVYEVVPKSRRNKKGSWTIGFFQRKLWELPENRGSTVLQYGRLDWIRRPEEDALCSEDVEMFGQPFTGTMSMAEWQRAKAVT